MANKVDANFTGLRYAMEVPGRPGVLPGEQSEPGVAVWKELEPNSYNDFGATVTTTARSPITAGRQKKKGRVTDLDASGGFQMDFTGDNMVEPLETFMFADWRASALARVVDGVDGAAKQYSSEGAFGSGYAVGSLVFAKGFDVTGNNGLKTVTAVTTDLLTVSETLTTEAGADTLSLSGFTLSITIAADVSNGFGTDKTVSYTFDEGDTVDDAGAALVLSLAALTPSVTATYTAGTDVLQIAAAENCGDSAITAVVKDPYGLTYASMEPTIEAATGTPADTRDIDLTTVATPLIIEGATLKVVGRQTAAGDLDVDVTDPLRPALVSTALDFTTLPLLPGKWVYLGGDTAASRFTNAGNNGFARIHTVAANRLTFDKTQNTMSAEANTTKTVQVFFGDLIKNESDPDLIKTKTIQFERKVVVGYEYLAGSHGNELTLNLETADKITADLTFVSFDAEPRDNDERKPGQFPPIATASEAFNTTSDVVRIRASHQDSASPLFGFVQSMNIAINNNVEPLKAIGVLGAFDASIGDFEVTGEITAYFNDIEAVRAVRNSDSLTIDLALTFDNQGWVFDIPLFTGSNALLNVEKDAAITIPLGMNAAEHQDLHTTLIICYFPYLPNVAT